eukprot:TRINITY_DN21383_c0_g1_i1.p1 TRINITY_DN21383_c0_g1~~TRINITY_DN21383_c0_g1_i1.p1  ORF type:complete len:595 (+),score=163.35 TRINITY_DN21383_c0_g1_i1:65-1786(+)
MSAQVEISEELPPGPVVVGCSLRQQVGEFCAAVIACGALLLLCAPQVAVLGVAMIAAVVGGTWLSRKVAFVRVGQRLPGRITPCNPYGDIWHGFSRPPVPAVTPAHPDFLGWFYEMQEEFREHGLFRLWAGHPWMPFANCAVLVYDPKLVRDLLGAKLFGVCRKGTAYMVAEPLIGRHSILSLADGERWRFLRKLVRSGFHQDVLKNAVPITAGVIESICGRWADTGVTQIDTVEETLKITMDVFGKVAMSHDFRSVHASTTKEAPLWDAFDLILRELAQRCQDPLWLVPGLQWNRKLKFNAAIRVLDERIDGVVRERMKAAGQGADSPRAYGRDLLSLLLGSHEKDTEGSSRCFTAIELCDNLRTLLFAGHDTTASALAWSLHVLASPEHAEAERRLREEIALTCPSGTPTWEDIEAMPYLSAFIWEVLRIWPSAAFSRAPHEGLRLGKHIIPRGAELFVFPQLLHRDPANWEDPLCFRPARWLPEGERSTAADVERVKAEAERDGRFLPFSLGLRNCVGRGLASAELRTALVCLVRRFKFHLVPGAPPPAQVVYMTTGPNCLPIRLEPIPQ